MIHLTNLVFFCKMAS